MRATIGSSRRARSVLVVLMVALLAISAGCTGVMNGSGDGGPSAGPATDVIPADVDMIAYNDVQGMVGDDTLRGLANHYFTTMNESSPYYTGPASVEEALSQASEQTALSPDGVKSVTLYGQYSDGASGVASTTDYGGAVVETSWSESEFVGALENQSDGTEVTESTYAGYTVYTSESAGETSALGVLGDGRYVMGTQAVVEDTLDVAAGDAAAVSGDLASAFENTRDGYVRFASTVQSGQVPTDQLGQAVNNANIFNQVQVVSSAQYVSGDSVGVEMTMTVGDSNTAKNLADVTEGGLAYARQVTNQSPQGADFQGLVDRDSVSVSQSGSDVTVTMENPASEFESLIDVLLGVGA